MIIGLDVGRNSAVAAALDHFPANPQRYFADHRREFVRLKPDRSGFEYLASIQPSGLILEPTGSHYAAIWYRWAISANIPIFWVGHADLSHQRGSYGFQNKRDDEDAFCLALTYFDDRFIDRHGRKRFLKPVLPAIAPVREKFLQLEQLDKNKNAFVNQIRQRLCKEFPEAAERRVQRSEKLGFSPFWSWLAGTYSYARAQNDYGRSIAHDLGISISEFTREHAYQVVLLEKRAYQIEKELRILVDQPEFFPYLKVFRRLGLGFINQVLMLSQIYPFEKFLIDGKPWIEWESSRCDKTGGKLQKRHRSLRSFQAYLGLSYKLKQSGDSLMKKFLGSELVRAHLYMWVVDYLRRPPKGTNLNNFIIGKDPKSGQHIHAFNEAEEFKKLPVFRVQTSVGQSLNRKVIELEYDGVKGSDKIVRLLFRATALLFAELCKELL